MPKYKGVNKECELFDEIYSVASARIVIKDGKAVDNNTECPGSGNDRVVVRTEGMTTYIAGTNDQRNRMAKQW